MSKIKTTLIEWNTAAGEKYMQVVVAGGTAAERKKQKEKTLIDLKAVSYTHLRAHET